MLAHGRRKRLAAGAAGALLLTVFGTASFAAIPDSDDSEFHACVSNSGSIRAVYMIDDESQYDTCPGGYTEKVWSQTGPQGPQGVAGADGATGPQGPAGDPADLGYQVVTGTTSVPDSGSSAITTVTVTAPAGKKAISAGISTPSMPAGEGGLGLVKASYPSDGNWVFKFIGQSVSGGYGITHYVIFVNS